MRYQDEGPGEERGRTVLLRADRREFVKLLGSGVTIFFVVPGAALAAEPARPPGRQGYPTDFNAYLRIGPDGRVTCLVGKVELGQGSMTSLAQLLAEDLDVGLDQVDMVMGDTDRCPWDMGTFGSLGIRMFGPVLRAAAAEARAVLLELAAERLGAPAQRLEVTSGVVSDTADRTKQVTYARLAAGQRIERHLEKPPAVRQPADFRVIGSAAPRRDALEKVTGRAKYAGDISFPDLLHARVLRPPAHGAKLTAAGTAAAEKISRARVVREEDLIAVLHEHPDEAERALGLIEARFDRPAAALDEDGIFAHLVKQAPAGDLVHESGRLADGREKAARLFDETYLNGYVAHAPMETHAAVARAGEDGRITVWASTQAPFIVRGQVAEALGVAPDRVRVITPYVGGGFGGKSSAAQAVQAARLAKITGRAVQVMWDRADEFFHDTFRPAAVVTIRSGLTAEGTMSFWDFEVWCAGDREAKQFYDVPHQRTVSHGGWHSAPGLHPFGVGPWRAPSVNTNTFARESQIDIMAAAAGADPVDFRLRHLSDDRMRRVLDAAAGKFGWTPKPAPSGRGVGVACAIYLGTYVATMAEVEVDRARGGVQVKRIVCAQDMGVVVNPEGARQQMEGSLTMGMGYALTEEVRFRGGEVRDANFDTYEIPRFSWLPRIETILIDAPGIAASGCGEPPIVGMGAVLANAIHDAAGVRLRRLPMTPARIKVAIERRT